MPTGSALVSVLKKSSIALLMAFAIVLVLAFVLINPIAERLLIRAVEEKSNGLYTLTIEQTRLNPISGNISLEKVRLHPQQEQYQQQAKKAQAPPQLYDIALEQLEIKHLRWLQLLLSKKIEVSAIRLKQPQLSITYDKQAKRQSQKGSLPSAFKYIKVKQLAIEQGFVSIHHKATVINKSQEASNITIVIEGIMADFRKQQDFRQAITAQHFQLALENYVLHLPDSVFTVKVGALNYSTEEQLLAAANVVLQANPAQNNRLEAIQQDSAFKYLYNISVPGLKLNRTDLLKGWSQQALSIGSLTFEQPEVKITHYVNVPASTDSAKINYKHLHRYIKNIFQSINVDQLNVEEAKFSLAEKDQTPVVKHRAQSISLRVDSILIDSSIAAKPRKIYYAQNASLKVKDISSDLPNDLYTLTIDSVTVSSKEALFQSKHLRLIPRLSKKAFAKKLPYRSDRIDLYNQTLRVEGIRFGELILKQQLTADEVLIEDTEVSLFRDQSLPLKQKEKPQPHQAMQALPLEFIVHKVSIKKAHILYQELPPKSKEPGEISFQDLYATITNLTNSQEVLSQQDKMYLQVKTMVYGKSSMEAALTFPLQHPLGQYSMQGQLDAIDATTFNKILAPLAKVELSNGKIEKASFDIVYDNNQARGHLTLYYKNLKLALLNKEREKQGLFKKIGSLLINKIALKTDNQPGENFQKGTIDTARKKNRTIFNHWAQAFIDGMISSMTTAPVEGATEEVVGTKSD